MTWAPTVKQKISGFYAYQEIRREPYTFQWADRQWTLPHLGELDYRLQAEIESVEGLDVKQLENLFARIFGPTQAAAWAQVEVPGDEKAPFRR